VITFSLNPFHYDSMFFCAKYDTNSSYSGQSIGRPFSRRSSTYHSIQNPSGITKSVGVIFRWIHSQKQSSPVWCFFPRGQSKPYQSLGSLKSRLGSTPHFTMCVHFSGKLRASPIRSSSSFSDIALGYPFRSACLMNSGSISSRFMKYGWSSSSSQNACVRITAGSPARAISQFL
jgi:hypothetical protein